MAPFGLTAVNNSELRTASQTLKQQMTPRPLPILVHDLRDDMVHLQSHRTTDHRQLRDGLNGIAARTRHDLHTSARCPSPMKIMTAEAKLLAKCARHYKKKKITQDQRTVMPACQPHRTRLHPKVQEFDHLLQLHHLRFLVGRQQPSSLAGRIGRYEVLDVIGKGGFGLVVSARQIRGNTLTRKLATLSSVGRRTKQKRVAIKKLSKANYSSARDLDMLEMELRLMARLKHKNLLHADEIIHSEQSLHIVTELASNDLLGYASRYWNDGETQGMPDGTLRVLTKTLLEALSYLHNHGVAHMDIKPENVLIMQDCPPEELTCKDIKLSDFGLAVECSSSTSSQGRGPFAVSSATKIHHNCAQGTPGYWAPEVHVSSMTRMSYDCCAADMWSLGVTIMVLSDGACPEMWFPIFGGHKSHLSEGDLWLCLDAALDDLDAWIALNCVPASPGDKRRQIGAMMQSLLQLEPKERPTARLALRHNWLK